MGSSSRVPGVGVEALPPVTPADFRTGVLGVLSPAVAVAGGAVPAVPVARAFESFAEFAQTFRDERGGWRNVGGWRPEEFVWSAVHGFFLNGGARCWLLSYGETASRSAALELAVAALAEVDDVDLVCAPALFRSEDGLTLQKQLIQSCAKRDDWFLILDAPAPDAGARLDEAWIEALCKANTGPHLDAALYHPWIVLGADAELPPGSPASSAQRVRVPPSGHVAGIYAATDRRVGAHKAPANEPLRGVVDLAGSTASVLGANALRALPGRGIRVWGARTLAAAQLPEAAPDAQVSTRRLVLTLRRRLVRALDWAVFEANDFRLWLRIQRESEAALLELFSRGALRGKTPQEAFYVKCDGENNPPELRAQGLLLVEIGIAPVLPSEFIQIRLVRSAESLTAA